jgi:hypothetical protein
MVAHIAPPPHKAEPVPQSALAGRGPLVRFTVDDVQAMLVAGLLADDSSTELLNGCIVRTDRSKNGGDPAMHSPGHRYTVRRLTHLAGMIDAPERHVQIQLPVVCALNQMPEADFAVIRGTDNDYVNRLPAASDALCVIEVADSSLERDRNEKLPVYARAGLGQYIILNLRDNTAEVFEQPDSVSGTYPPPAVVKITGAISIGLGKGLTFAVDLASLLPSRG